MIRLCALHLAGNAALLWLGYYWLGLSESNGANLAYSAAVVFIFMLGGLWLHGTTLVYFERKKRLPFWNLAPLFVLALFVGLAYSLIGFADRSFGHDAFVIGSYTTMKLRRPVAPSGVLQTFHGFIWLIRWLVVPVIALPIAHAVANEGWWGFRGRAFRTSRRPLFWIACLALLLLAVWVPFRLFFWVPPMSSFSLEVVSVAARLSLAYLLFVAGILGLEFVTEAMRR